jgi:cell division protein ZipA
MDIKDWILIGGGILLAAVIGHGFWLAWRSRRDTLRMDIEPNVPREEVDELDLLRAELPNGGARVKKGAPPEQGRFELEPAAPPTARTIPSVARTAVSAQRKTMPRREPRETVRGSVRDSVREPTGESIREPIREHVREPIREPVRESVARPIVPERTRERSRGTATFARVDRTERAEPAHAEPSVSKVAPDVIVINVLARNGAKFGGAELVEAFLRNGLKFGDMNIFHRIAPTTKVMQFSVASAVEPGTFDLSTVETFKTPGVSFFLRLPGPDQPLDVFEDMLAVSRDVAASLSADLKDEQLSVMTGQTIEHCRSRIEEFSRRRMSQRA